MKKAPSDGLEPVKRKGQQAGHWMLGLRGLCNYKRKEGVREDGGLEMRAGVTAETKKERGEFL